jgi:hypothetical protein
MSCRSCGSKDHAEFGAEIGVHALGLKNVDKPPVFLFPRLVVCMNCGLTEFTIAENELRLLGKRPAIRTGGDCREIPTEQRKTMRP